MEVIIVGIITLMVGIVAGILLGTRVFRQKPIGDLRIDRSDPDGPHLFLELDSDVPVILAQKQVVLRVKAKNFLPHE